MIVAWIRVSNFHLSVCRHAFRKYSIYTRDCLSFKRDSQLKYFWRNDLPSRSKNFLNEHPFLSFTTVRTRRACVTKLAFLFVNGWILTTRKWGLAAYSNILSSVRLQVALGYCFSALWYKLTANFLITKIMSKN